MKIAKETFTLVCDDIRNEVGGKASLMGLYQNEIKFNTIPALKEKLCFAVFLRELKTIFSKCRITIKIPGSDPVKMHHEPPPDLSEKKDVQIFIVLSPIRFGEEGDLILEANFDNSKKPDIVYKIKVALKNTN